MAKFLKQDKLFEEGSIDKIIELSKVFKGEIINERKLYDELTILTTSKEMNRWKECKDVDQLICKIQEKKFPNLLDLFLMVSACSVSNAEVERYFSRSGLIITKKVSNLHEDNFNDRKNIISGMQFFDNDLSLLKIDSNLIQKVSQASSKYKRKLEEEKRLSDEASKRRRTEEQFESHLELIAAIAEEKEWSKNHEGQMNTIREKLTIEKEKAKKMLAALSEKAVDTSDPQEKVEVIRELSLNLTATNLEIKRLEEVLNQAQTQLIEKQNSVIDKIRHNK